MKAANILSVPASKDEPDQALLKNVWGCLCILSPLSHPADLDETDSRRTSGWLLPGMELRYTVYAFLCPFYAVSTLFLRSYMSLLAWGFWEFTPFSVWVLWPFRFPTEITPFSVWVLWPFRFPTEFTPLYGWVLWPFRFPTEFTPLYGLGFMAFSVSYGIYALYGC